MENWYTTQKFYLLIFHETKWLCCLLIREVITTFLKSATLLCHIGLSYLAIAVMSYLFFNFCHVKCWHLGPEGLSFSTVGFVILFSNDMNWHFYIVWNYKNPHGELWVHWHLFWENLSYDKNTIRSHCSSLNLPPDTTATSQQLVFQWHHKKSCGRSPLKWLSCQLVILYKQIYLIAALWNSSKWNVIQQIKNVA